MLELDLDNDGELQELYIKYQCVESMPNIHHDLLENKPHSDLMCHEFEVQTDSCEHRLLFANGMEIAIQFTQLEISLTANSAT